MPKMCLFSQFFAKNVITSTKFEYFDTDPVFAMTIRSNPCIFRLSAIFFQLSPLAEHRAKVPQIDPQNLYFTPLPLKFLTWTMYVW